MRVFNLKLTTEMLHKHSYLYLVLSLGGSTPIFFFPPFFSEESLKLNLGCMSEFY